MVPRTFCPPTQCSPSMSAFCLFWFCCLTYNSTLFLPFGSKQKTPNTFHVPVTDVNVQMLLQQCFAAWPSALRRKGTDLGVFMQGISGVLGEALVSLLPLWGAQPLAVPSEHGLGVDARAQMGDGLGAFGSLQLWHKEGEPAKGRFEIDVCRKQFVWLGLGAFFVNLFFKSV